MIQPLPTPEHRTQKERSSAMRQRILQATFECLVELGYARTSTPEVLRRTGVSRGALLHHFPTKTDLVVAAVDDVFARQLDAFRDSFDGLEGRDDRAGAAIELLWETLSEDTYYAWLELVVAARTDPVLRAKIHEVNTRFDEDAAGLHDELFPRPGGSAGSGDLPMRFAFATLSGLAVSRIHENPERIREVVELMKKLAVMFDTPSSAERS